MADEHDDAQERSPEEIRRDIERTRANMEETVDELGERLNPHNLADEMWDKVRSGTISQVTETFREHPIPLALMGLGLGWLAVENATRKTARSRTGPGTWAPAQGRRGPYGPEAVSHDDPDWPHSGTGTRIKQKVGEIGHRISEAGEHLADRAHEKSDALQAGASEKTHEMRDRAAEKLGTVRERASDVTHRIADETRTRARSAREGFGNLLDENPLMVGALAFGVGLASGLAAPSTPVEERLMGPMSDTVKDEAKRLARDTSQRAKRVAREAVDTAKAEVERAREDEEGTVHAAVDDLKDAAKRVMSTTVEAAREAAQEENLTAESLGREARQVASRARAASRRPTRSGSKVPEGG
jgi:gas vesicle protein